MGHYIHLKSIGQENKWAKKLFLIFFAQF